MSTASLGSFPLLHPFLPHLNFLHKKKVTLPPPHRQRLLSMATSHTTERWLVCLPHHTELLRTGLRFPQPHYTFLERTRKEDGKNTGVGTLIHNLREIQATSDSNLEAEPCPGPVGTRITMWRALERKS